MGEPRTSNRTGDAITTIDAAGLTRALAGGAEALRRQCDAINAINVFPVPDGDTGTNMLSTMRAAVEDVARTNAGDAAGVMRAAARGALMGAKGNSGVILSQILAGLADLPAEQHQLDGASIAAGLQRAREKAYGVVSAPKEGTILTAVAAAAEGASGAGAAPADVVLASAVDACEEAVARTPDLLPVLKEAGVVDSGAQGLFVLLEGMLHALRGEDAATHEGGFGAIDASWLAVTQQVHEHEGVTSGFCTEFVLSGEALDPDALRAALQAMGESVLVVGGGDFARVHLHTQEPQRALAYARGLGELVHEKVDDMEAQFRALAAKQAAEAAGEVEAIAVVAVAAGEGLQELLRSMGATVVHGGPTMNPSAGDIRAAIEGSHARSVIVLPNDKNIVLAAKLATDGMPGDIRVLETTSVPQGVAALIALNTEATVDDNLDEMREAIGNVRTAEITLAARATTHSGLTIAEGQPIGIIDNELAVAEATVDDAARACVRRMLDGRDGAVVTLYAGEGQPADATEALAASLRQECACDVEVIEGGQPHYPYLIGVE